MRRVLCSLVVCGHVVGCHGAAASAAERSTAATATSAQADSSPSETNGGSLSGAYTDPAYFVKVPWGAYSHWLQPWRGYLETMPATTFLNGLGINFNVPSDSNCPDLVAEMLQRHGICRARIEIGWNNLDFDDDTKLAADADQRMRKLLTACQKHDIRPLILLNSNEGGPCPNRTFDALLAQDANAGDRTIVLEKTDQVKPGYTGVMKQVYPAAYPLITSIDADGKCELSAPLRKPLAKGSIELATLKYRPFSPPTTADYRETIAGWQKYAATVATFVADALKTTGKADLGFDIEIWNEMTFGDQFLRVNQYYDPPLYPDLHEPDFLWSLGPDGITPRTIEYVDTHPEIFAGVQISDGFSNTLPWQGAAAEPARIGAIDKHPYPSRQTFPLKTKAAGQPIDALGEIDRSGFIPAYTELFPEYAASALQTETCIREMHPALPGIKPGSFDAGHGRDSRVVHGRVVPCFTLITEVNISPIEDNPSITAERALALKAKSTSRFFCFFLNKGVTQVDLFAVTVDGHGDKELGIVQDNFMALAGTRDAVYPSDDAQYTSPALAVTGRIAARMRESLDPSLTSAMTRSIQVDSISDPHNHYQFAGDGTAAHPNLFNRDVLAILPFQVNATRFVIPYYVMSRDYTHDLPAEHYTIRLSGLHGSAAQISAYDPITDHEVPVNAINSGDASLTVDVMATDYPRLLTVQE